MPCTVAWVLCSMAFINNKILIVYISCTALLIFRGVLAGCNWCTCTNFVNRKHNFQTKCLK